MPIRKHDPFADPIAGLTSDYNPYMQLLREGGAGKLPLLYGPALAPCPGRWREKCAASMQREPTALILEIGSHLGEVILQMAQNHPETAFLGMDITFKRVVKVAQKTHESGHKNLLSVLANAKCLDQLFSPAELDGCIVFFPDPWIKKQRQWKNQLLDPEFLQVLSSKLKPSGFFWFKTDCLPYFEAVRGHLDTAGWQPELAPQGLTAETYVSRFQRMFAARGLPSYELLVRPPQASLPSASSFGALDILS